MWILPAQKKGGAELSCSLRSLNAPAVFLQSEITANMSIDPAELFSSSDLPVREGDAERERFYLTTAINYTNGKHGSAYFVKLRLADMYDAFSRLWRRRL